MPVGAALSNRRLPLCEARFTRVGDALSNQRPPPPCGEGSHVSPLVVARGCCEYSAQVKGIGPNYASSCFWVLTGGSETGWCSNWCRESVSSCRVESTNRCGLRFHALLEAGVWQSRFEPGAPGWKE